SVVDSKGTSSLCTARRRLCRKDLITRYDLCCRSKRRRHAAIFLIGKLDRLCDRSLGEIMTAQDVAHFDARVGAWMFGAPLAPHFDAIVRHLLALLAQD